MEGDVSSIMSRPTLPVTSPNPNEPTSNNNNNNNNSVHRYASRDLRTREAQAEIEKWDAWNECAGQSRTDAKRMYITTLIETMKEYASGTQESRELVGELEFVWNQIKTQSGSEPDARGSPKSGGSGGDGDKESPTRQLERAGMGLGLGRSESNIMSFGSNRPSVGSANEDADGRKQARLKRTESGLRVLSPASQGDSGSVVEPIDEEDAIEEADEAMNTAPSSPVAQRRSARGGVPAAPNDASMAAWQRQLESSLHSLKTEIAALREQLSANHLLSSSTYSHTYYTMSTTQRVLHRAKLYIRRFGLMFFQQIFLQLGVLAAVLIWGRINGDLRIERYVRDFVRRFRKWVNRVSEGLLFWVFDLFSRDGRFSFVGRLLRIF